MITVNQYIERLQKLKDAGYGELIVITSNDDEGNSYQKVNKLPDTFRVEDISEYYLEADFDDDEDDELTDFEPNCVIVN
jgi:cobalamin biosynthesis Co2+ chelatase CbiK